MSLKKKLELAAGLLFAGYVVGVASITFVRFSDHQKWRDHMLAIKALADREVPTLRSAIDLPPLTEACAGKLTPQGHRAIIGYLDEGDLPPSTPVAGRVTGHSEDAEEAWYVSMSTSKEEPSLSYHFELALNPRYWAVRLPYIDPGLSKYLVLSVPLNIHLPLMLLGEQGYDGGSADLRTRVFSLPEGKVLCEGASKPRGPDQIEISGRGRDMLTAEVVAKTKGNTDLQQLLHKAIVTTALVELCTAADEQYCKHLTAMK